MRYAVTENSGDDHGGTSPENKFQERCNDGASTYQNKDMPLLLSILEKHNDHKHSIRIRRSSQHLLIDMITSSVFILLIKPRWVGYSNGTFWPCQSYQRKQSVPTYDNKSGGKQSGRKITQRSQNPFYNNQPELRNKWSDGTMETPIPLNLHLEIENTHKKEKLWKDD